MKKISLLLVLTSLFPISFIVKKNTRTSRQFNLKSKLFPMGKPTVKTVGYT